MFGNLSTQSKDYDKLVQALEQRFAPPNQTELYRVQLRERRQTASETLSALGQDIRRLANLAYPTAPIDVRDTLAKEQFIDALHSSDMRLRVKQARPSDLNDAVRHAVELEAYNRAEKRKTEDEGYLRSTNAMEQKTSTDSKSDSQSDKFEALTNTLQLIQKELKSLKAQKSEYRDGRSQGDRRPYQRPQPYPRTQNSSERQTWKRRCFTCGSEDHLARDCEQNQAKSGNQQQDKDKGSGKSAKVSGIHNSGLFVSALVNGQPINCLLDTGATLTIISTKVWETLDRSKLTLIAFDQNISTASGSPIEVAGRTRVQL